MVRRAVMLCVSVVVGCAGDPRLIVFLQTDLHFGSDFTVVEASLERGSRVELVRYETDGDYVDGVRVATFDVTAGTHDVRVRLLTASGEVAAARRVLVLVRGDTAATVVITRRCGFSECPGSDPAATECIGGRCVPPECTPEEPDVCGPLPTCDVTTCIAPVACARAGCALGECLVGPVDARCGAGQRCDLSAGCVDEAVADAGASDAGPADAGRGDGGPTDAGPTGVADGGDDYRPAPAECMGDLLIVDGPDGCPGGACCGSCRSSPCTFDCRGSPCWLECPEGFVCELRCRRGVSCYLSTGCGGVVSETDPTFSDGTESGCTLSLAF